MTTDDTAGDIPNAKSALRKSARSCRAAAHEADGATAGEALSKCFSEAISLPASAVIGSYWPFRDEIDCAPLLLRLHELGHGIGLPVVVAPTKDGRPRPMIFRPWRPGMRLAKGRLGEPTLPPDADYGAGDLTPTVLLVPLLAFDRRGYRIGYGGGNFDATIAQLRTSGTILTIGLAYAEQEVEVVPIEPHDQPLDWIVTQRGSIEIGKAEH